MAVQGVRLRGRSFLGRTCSLVERRLFGPPPARRLPSTAPGSSACVEPGATEQGVGQAHCWVLRDRAIDLPRASVTSNCLESSPRKRGSRQGDRPSLENYTVDASIFVARQATKGTWWMPWHQEPMKDVGACDKPREVGNRALIRGFPNGETQLESCPVTST